MQRFFFFFWSIIGEECVHLGVHEVGKQVEKKAWLETWSFATKILFRNLHMFWILEGFPFSSFRYAVSSSSWFLPAFLTWVRWIGLCWCFWCLGDLFNLFSKETVCIYSFCRNHFGHFKPLGFVCLFVCFPSILLWIFFPLVLTPFQYFLDFPDGSDGKESPCQCKRPGFDPWVRKIPWRREWLHPPVLLPGKSHG